ncbi:MBL fold metallo-hydrolase [Microbacterium sp. 18062]|uniref:MBL fold metallo-hydrolase n=1 Tax=Microbacterium sp. 18062 TaxID=2681410 RepID=UPI001356E11F|nr:MBL fold metallo-hydrolase [Microbacterium sp. 18062]
MLTRSHIPASRVGHVSIIRIEEADPVPTPGFPAGTTLDTYRRYSDSIDPRWYDSDGAPLLGMSGFVLSTGGVNVLVDTCNGDWPVAGLPPQPEASPFVGRLRAAGLAPEDIHVVVNTHLHLDHVGCNTHEAADGSVVATFPNAEYLFVDTEWEWAQQSAAAGNPSCGRVDRAVAPLLEAGRGRLVSMDHRVTDEIALLPTPGHTPGHVSVEVTTDAGSAVITGDMMHHPIQLFEPGLCSLFEEDSDEAARTRIALLERWRRRDVLLLGTHFPGSGIGLLEQDARGFRYAETAL